MTGRSLPRTYSEIQTAIADTIRAAGLLPAAARIAPAPGNLTEAWLKQHSGPLQGAALVAIGRIAKLERQASGGQRHTLGLGVFLIPPPGRADDQAARLVDLAGAIVSLIDGNRFGTAGASAPEQIRAQNLYSPSLDKRGTTLWQIDWRQAFLLFEGADGEETVRGRADV